MIKKIFIPLFTLSTLIGGCNREAPKDNKTHKTDTTTTQLKQALNNQTANTATVDSTAIDSTSNNQNPVIADSSSFTTMMTTPDTIIKGPIAIKDSVASKFNRTNFPYGDSGSFEIFSNNNFSKEAKILDNGNIVFRFTNKGEFVPATDTTAEFFISREAYAEFKGDTLYAYSPVDSNNVFYLGKTGLQGVRDQIDSLNLPGQVDGIKAARGLIDNLINEAR